MADDPSTQPYRVLARKYRPSDFASLIGQEAMVQTLSNAIALKRLAHAFILTGVRGVGKTTTARIIAKALNCIGPDGKGKETSTPCGVCENCSSISEDRHVDVMEIDAASRTGVDDIRELIDGVLYRPISARYKVYIIDEVHMLSRNAFNALLKTLEEPPEHVKFIFATTEIRRVPVTVLSRCQRFDLRRVKFQVLVDHFTELSSKENANISPGAIGLIARASDGSVRDGLSLLDQAIAHCGPETEISEDAVREMLGVAERVQIFDLFEQLMAGDIADALSLFDAMHSAGADPAAVLQDLAELTHWLTRLKAAPDVAKATPVSDLSLDRGLDVSARLPMSVLARAWQILLKGLSEVRVAPSAFQAADMVLVRIAYAADLPTPVEAVAFLEKAKAAPGDQQMASTSETTGSREVVEAVSTPTPIPETVAIEPIPATDGPTALSLEPRVEPADIEGDDKLNVPTSFEDMVGLFSANREPLLHAYLVNNVHLVKYEIGKISIRVSEGPPRDFMQSLSRCLNEWTGRAWFFEASQEEGQSTLQQKRNDAVAEQRAAAIAHPLVQKTLDAFPDAEVVDVRSVIERDAGFIREDSEPTARKDYLSDKHKDDETEPRSLEQDDTNEDYT